MTIFKSKFITAQEGRKVIRCFFLFLQTRVKALKALRLSLCAVLPFESTTTVALSAVLMIQRDSSFFGLIAGLPVGLNFSAWPSSARDWQGYGKPGGFWVGCSWVWVWVRIFYPLKTHTLAVGFTGIGPILDALEGGRPELTRGRVSWPMPS